MLSIKIRRKGRRKISLAVESRRWHEYPWYIPRPGQPLTLGWGSDKFQALNLLLLSPLGFFPRNWEGRSPREAVTW